MCPECGNDDSEIEYKGGEDDYPSDMWYCWECMDYFRWEPDSPARDDK